MGDAPPWRYFGICEWAFRIGDSGYQISLSMTFATRPKMLKRLHYPGYLPSFSMTLFFLLTFILCFFCTSADPPVGEKQALLAFFSNTGNLSHVRWNATTSPCDWVGVKCDKSRSFVYSLRLPNAGLVGSIPRDTLARLTQLRVVSLRANLLSGNIPADLANLTFIRKVYLQKNRLTGAFDFGLGRLSRLVHLDLSSNNLTGSILVSVTDNLTSLTGIFLQNNGFSGQLPSFNHSKLVALNVSNNNFSGHIPVDLSSFPASSFMGNQHLCGYPLQPCLPVTRAPHGPNLPVTMPLKKPLYPKEAVMGIVVVALIILIASSIWLPLWFIYSGSIWLPLWFIYSDKEGSDEVPAMEEEVPDVQAAKSSKVPTAGEEELEVPTAEKEETQVPAVEELGVPTAGEEELEAPTAEKEETQVPAVEELGVPTAGEEELEAPTAEKDETQVPAVEELGVPTAGEEELEAPAAEKDETQVPAVEELGVPTLENEGIQGVKEEESGVPALEKEELEVPTVEKMGTQVPAVEKEELVFQ